MSQKNAGNQYRPYAAYYEPIFNKFKDNASPLSWNWAAFFFSFLWQIFGGLWLKGLLYGTVVILLELWAKFLNIPLLNHVIWFGTSLFYGLISNYDYYLLKIHKEPLWLRFPYRTHKNVVWGVISVLLILIILSSMGYSRLNSVPGSYYSSIQSLGNGNFQIKLHNGEKFGVSLPKGWHISRSRSEGPWIAITLPEFDELGLSICDLPDKLQHEPEDSMLSAIVRKQITEQSWINRLIFNPSDWACSQRESQGGGLWRFCGYMQTHGVSFQVIYAVLGRQIIMVTHSARDAAREAIFKKQLKSFLSSIRLDNGADKRVVG